MLFKMVMSTMVQSVKNRQNKTNLSNLKEETHPGFSMEKTSSSSYIVEAIWVFPKIGVPQNGWFIMENPIKMG